MRVSTAAASALALTLGIGVAACGTSANTDQTVSTASRPSISGTAVNPGGPIQTSTATGSVSTTGTDTITAPGAATAGDTDTATAPVTVTTATITAPDSGGAGLTGASPSTATTAATGPECVASDLTAEAVPPNSAPGTTVLGFELSNHSAASCVSEGFPGIGLVSASGAISAPTVTRSTGDALGSTPVTKISVGPGQTMSFRVTLHDSGTGCASYTGVQIIPPNDTANLKVTLPDGAVQSCGAVTVSPVESGASATGQ